MDGRAVGPLTIVFFAALRGRKTAISMDKRAGGPLTDVFYTALVEESGSGELLPWTVNGYIHGQKSCRTDY